MFKNIPVLCSAGPSKQQQFQQSSMETIPDVLRYSQDNQPAIHRQPCL